MEKATSYVRLVRELALTALILAKLVQVVIELVSPVLNYIKARLRREKLRQYSAFRQRKVRFQSKRKRPTTGPRTCGFAKA